MILDVIIVIAMIAGIIWLIGWSDIPRNKDDDNWPRGPQF